METMHYLYGAFMIFAVMEFVQPTCVLESDFGFKINCAFKKSGLFRVRNLGGLKAHASLGFSLGDELGFEQSLTNLDPSRRRSVSVKNGAPANFIADTSVRPTAKQEKRGKQNRIMMRPMAPASRPNQAAMDKLSSLHRRVSSTMRPIVVSGPTVETPATMTGANPTITMAKPLPMGVPPFKPIPPKQDTLKVLPIAVSTKKSYTPLQIPQSKGPGLLYQSENYYPHISHDQVSKMVSQMTASHNAQPLLRITPMPIVMNTPKLYSIPTTLNPFVPMPIASPPTQALTIIPGPIFNSIHSPLAPLKTPTFSPQNTFSVQKNNPVSNFVDPVPHQVHDLASLYPVYNTKKVDDYNSISGYGDDTTLKFNKEDINAKIAEIAKAGNISMEAVEAAIALRQQQLLNKYANLPLPTTPTTTTTTSTTTEEPFIFQAEPEPELVLPTVTNKPKRTHPTSGKVMNAPREYYPVGYEKNFDDQFQSKVDLPETNFHCGDQKYFPGLYGDEGLGCMVFHVCALTDDGLVMKSFLCPESTLFDQTILKCNWWFYVDCKNSRRLYDTNIPVSKSYQLMKALTFFSSYKKDAHDDDKPKNPEDMEGIKEAISILENQDTIKPIQINNELNALQIITPQPYVDERNIHKVDITNETSPVYRSNRNYSKPPTSSSRRISAKRKSPEPLKQNFNVKPATLSVNAGSNSNENNKPTNSSERITRTSSFENSSERKHRRRLTMRNNNNNTSTTENVVPQTTTTSKPLETTTPSVETIKQEIFPIDQFQKTDIRQETLTDQVENIDKIDPTISRETENSPPVKRFYRSSAEIKEGQEMTMIKNEKVQIIRPTPMAKLVGEFQTPTATIAKLDEAILGTSHHARVKKEAITVVTPQIHENTRTWNRYRT